MTRAVEPDADATAPGPATYAAVFAGGFCGGEARYGLLLLQPDETGSLPWTTLGVNVVGAFLLAVLLVVVPAVPGPRAWLRPLLGTGLLGAFTTFSAVAFALDRLQAGGSAGMAATYAAGSLVLGVGAAAAGASLARAARS
jgi:CrcB protein